MRSSASRAKRPALALLVTTAAGCDWSEFDDLEDRASIVRFERAPQSDGMGQSLATASDDEDALVLVSGSPSRSASAVYALGFDQSPTKDAAQTGYCSRDNPNVVSCQAADNPAHFALANSREDVDLCFAYAWGQSADVSSDGVVARCYGDNADITLRVPSAARTARRRDFELNEENQPLWLTSDVGGQWLLGSLSAQNRAWYYMADETSSPPMNAISRPERSGASFGARGAVLRVDSDDARLLALSAPDEGRVWLYRADEDAAQLAGCLGERPGFGRALASGDVDGDGLDDLVISDEDVVTVFSGTALAQLPEAFSEVCSLAALPENALIGSFGCGSRLALSGCGKSLFGASLAVGDLDGDGDGEVIVGAPRMVVNGQDRAGAVLVYDVEGSRPHELSEVLYLSSAEGGDLMGTSVAAVPQKQGRSVVVAGGPGKSKVAVFFCSELVDPEDREGRCAP